MCARRVLLGAIGGDRQEDAARCFGCAVAQAGCILLTGGGDKNDPNLDEVKNATVLGMQSESPIVPRAIGVLPSETVAWDWPGPSHLLLRSGQAHYIRNLINGVTPDVVVVFGGSRGTLAEMGFAAVAGKRLFFYGGNRGGAVARLRRNLASTLKQDPADIDCFLRQPLAAFPSAFGRPVTATEVLALIDSTLQTATDWEGSSQDLVECCVRQVSPDTLNAKTGFPGLPDQPDACARFDAAVERISATA
jgi:hypothetical protein